MIVFDLTCDRDHVFEAWFGSTGDYEDQRQRGFLACPICNSNAVDKAAMAPRLSRKGNQLAGLTHMPAEPPMLAPVASASAPVSIAGGVPMAKEAPSPEQIKAMMTALAQAQTEILKNSDYVGKRFADEARAIHLGESEQRAIHGQTSVEEAQALIEEGISVAPLPFPVIPPSANN